MHQIGVLTQTCYLFHFIWVNAKAFFVSPLIIAFVSWSLYYEKQNISHVLLSVSTYLLYYINYFLMIFHKNDIVRFRFVRFQCIWIWQLYAYASMQVLPNGTSVFHYEWLHWLLGIFLISHWSVCQYVGRTS